MRKKKENYVIWASDIKKQNCVQHRAGKIFFRVKISYDFLIQSKKMKVGFWGSSFLGEQTWQRQYIQIIGKITKQD